METKTGQIIGLIVPNEYYRKLATIRRWTDNKRTDNGRPITNDDVYHYFRTLMEKLTNWLLDQTKDHGYRTSAFRVIGWTDHKVTLQETDNPFDAFWADNVIGHISDQYRFNGLLDQWQNDL